MRISTILVGVVASVALAIGSFGMAQANSQPAVQHDAASTDGTDHLSSMVHGVTGLDLDGAARLTERSAAHIWARGGLPTLVGKVNDDRDLTISQNPVPSGRYKIVARDTSKRHNWHIFGGNIDKETAVKETGTWHWKVRLQNGSYTVVCDPHARKMRFTLDVT